MADLRSNLALVNKLASAPVPVKPPELLAGTPAVAVLQAVVNTSVDLAALRSDVDKARLELAAHKARLTDLEQCIVSLDGSLAALQNDNLKELNDKLKGLGDVQSALCDRVSKVETLHTKLSGVFS